MFPAGFLCSVLNVNQVLCEGPVAYIHDPFPTDGIASSMSKQLAMSNNIEGDLTFSQVIWLCNTSYSFHI
jgi:hypothetical protein